MRVYLFLALLLSFRLWSVDAAELQTVPYVDLQRYAGTWYEIARLQNPWQQQCALNTTATYTLLDNGSMHVVNQCQTGKSPKDVQKVEGTAKVVDSTTNAKLKVSFTHRFLPSWLFSGDYWIIQLADDYSYAVVSEPTQKYLWILSRTPTLPEDVYQNILDKIGLQMPNLNLLNIMPTRQDQNLKTSG